MRANTTPNYELGLFYRTLLRQRIWSSQRDIAKALGVSMSSVSRRMTLTHIPIDVVNALGGAENLSFRIGELLLDAIARAGEQTIVARARDATRLGYTVVDDVIEYVVADRIPEPNLTAIKVRLGRDKRTFRVEVRELSRFMPHVSRLEEWLCRAFLMFQATLVSETSIGAKETRDRRVRSRVRTSRCESSVCPTGETRIYSSNQSTQDN
jgi:hypothetical protein